MKAIVQIKNIYVCVFLASFLLVGGVLFFTSQAHAQCVPSPMVMGQGYQGGSACWGGVAVDVPYGAGFNQPFQTSINGQVAVCTIEAGVLRTLVGAAIGSLLADVANRRIHSQYNTSYNPYDRTAEAIDGGVRGFLSCRIITNQNTFQRPTMVENSVQQQWQNNTGGGGTVTVYRPPTCRDNATGQYVELFNCADQMAQH